MDTSDNITSLRKLREYFELTLAQASAISNRKPNTLSELEHREFKGNVTISTLQEVADAIGANLEYRYVLKQPVEEARTRHAVIKYPHLFEEAGIDPAEYSEEELKELLERR